MINIAPFVNGGLGEKLGNWSKRLLLALLTLGAETDVKLKATNTC